MSLNSHYLSGIFTPTGSYLCNSIENGESTCSDINDPILEKTMFVNDIIYLSGNEDWMYCPERKAFYFHCQYKVLNQDANLSFDRMFCDRFVWREDNRKLGVGDFSEGLGDLVYFHDDMHNGSIESFSRWLKKEADQGNPVQLLYSLEKPFICSVDFSNHAKYYGFKNTYIEYSFMGRTDRINLG